MFLNNLAICQIYARFQHIGDNNNSVSTFLGTGLLLYFPFGHLSASKCNDGTRSISMTTVSSFTSPFTFMVNAGPLPLTLSYKIFSY